MEGSRCLSLLLSLKRILAQRLDNVSFIDCDTHFLVMSALESLAQTYPREFQLIVKDDVIRFLYEGRVIHRSRVGEDLVGSSSHGRLDLDMKVEDMNKEDPRCIQVLGFDQNVVISMYPPGIGADVCRALNDGVTEMLEKSKYRARFIPVAAIYFPWVQEAVEIRRTHDLGFKGVCLGPLVSGMLMWTLVLEASGQC